VASPPRAGRRLRGPWPPADLLNPLLRLLGFESRGPPSSARALLPTVDEHRPVPPLDSP